MEQLHNRNGLNKLGDDVRLKSLDLQLEWPETLLIEGLRTYIVEQLSKYGDPVRWAITSISFSSEFGSTRQLHIEAVVIIT